MDREGFLAFHHQRRHGEAGEIVRSQRVKVRGVESRGEGFSQLEEIGAGLLRHSVPAAGSASVVVDVLTYGGLRAASVDAVDYGLVDVVNLVEQAPLARGA